MKVDTVKIDTGLKSRALQILLQKDDKKVSTESAITSLTKVLAEDIKEVYSWQKELVRQDAATKRVQDNIRKAGHRQVVKLVSLKSPTYFIIHPSTRMNPSRGWQLTWYDSDNQPAGHSLFSTREDAIKSASGASGSWGPPHGDSSYKVVITTERSMYERESEDRPRRQEAMRAWMKLVRYIQDPANESYLIHRVLKYTKQAIRILGKRIEPNFPDIYIVPPNTQNPDMKGAFSFPTAGKKSLSIYLFTLPADLNFMQFRTARDMVEFLRVFVKSPQNRNYFIHEYTHRMDYARTGGKALAMKNPATYDTRVGYFANPAEFNAWYQQGAEMYRTLLANNVLYSREHGFNPEAPILLPKDFNDFMKVILSPDSPLPWKAQAENIRKTKYWRHLLKRLADFHREAVREYYKEAPTDNELRVLRAEISKAALAGLQAYAKSSNRGTLSPIPAYYKFEDFARDIYSTWLSARGRELYTKFPYEARTELKNHYARLDRIGDLGFAHSL